MMRTRIANAKIVFGAAASCASGTGCAAYEDSVAAAAAAAAQPPEDEFSV